MRLPPGLSTPAEGSQRPDRRPPDDGSDLLRSTELRDHLVYRSTRVEAIGQMLAQITHEVRNLLNAMSLNAELLDEEMAHLPAERRAEAREILETVTSEIARLLKSSDATSAAAKR